MHEFRSRLKGRETLLGTMVTLPAPAIAEILARLGFDWLFVDAEHGPLETADVLAILQAAGQRIACVVRVPEAADVPIKRMLDLGADGIIAPQVNTAAQAEAVVRAARYAPAGARGVGLARAHGYGLDFSDYLRRANDEVAVIVQAEHVDAVENIDAIVAVDGIDAVLLGPYDLSASLGRMGKVDDPAVVDAIDHVIAACLAAGMPLGFFGVTAAAVQPFVERGATLVVAGVDTLYVAEGGQAMLNALRSLKQSQQGCP